MIRFKHGNIDLELERPAFLVGNGINRADGCTMSWEELLMDSLQAEMRNAPKNDDDTRMLFKINNTSASVQISVDISNQKSMKNPMKSLSYPEIAELALLRKSPESYDKDSKPEFLSVVTEKIKANIEKASRFNDNHEKMAGFAQEHKIPILTTNFDRNFLRTSCFEGQDLDKIRLNWIKSDKKIEKDCEAPDEKKQYDYQTLKNACFHPKSLNKIEDIHSEFAVWHIHGVISRPKSLCYTNWDYFNYCAKIKEISKEKKWDDHKNDSTWVDIFLDNDLIIMGLGLDSFETDLRALLSERNIKHKVTKHIKEEWKKPATIYIYRKEAAETEMPSCKKALFEALGIRCVPMEQDEIYEVEKYLK